MDLLQVFFTEEELKALTKLIDSGVRYEGVIAAGAASVLYQRIQSAQPFIEPEDNNDEE